MNDALVPVLIVAGVIVLGLIMRRATRPETAGEDDGVAPDGVDATNDSDDDPPHPDAHAPVTSDGVALLRMGGQIRLMPTEDHDDAPHPIGGEGEAPREREEGGGRRAAHGGLLLQAGDFTAARVRREPGEGWRVETLGRDGEFGMLTFDTEAVAREAMTLLEEVGIVRRPLDDDGATVPASSEDFEEARRRFEETERALALGTDDDDPPPPNEWSSRR